MLCIDVAKQETYVVGEGLHGFEKWEGGVLARNGAMYCIPLKSKQVLMIHPAGEGKAVMVDEDGHSMAEHENDLPTPPPPPMPQAKKAAVQTEEEGNPLQWLTKALSSTTALATAATTKQAAPAKSRSQCRREKRNGAPKPKPPPGAKTLEQVEQERRAKVAAKEQNQPANGGWGNSNGGKAAGLIDARTLYNARTPD